MPYRTASKSDLRGDKYIACRCYLYEKLTGAGLSARYGIDPTLAVGVHIKAPTYTRYKDVLVSFEDQMEIRLFLESN